MNRSLNVDQIKKLWTLNLIVRSGSLKKAALQAKVSPSAISQTLTALEKAIGKPLLVRQRGSVSPTMEALRLLEAVRPAFEVFERLDQQATEPTPEIAWLNFGAPERFSVDLLPRLVAGLHDKMPQLKLGLMIGRNSSLMSMVRKGELCTALITETEGIERFHSRFVGEDRMGFYISRFHSIADLGWSAIQRFPIGIQSPGKEGHPLYYRRFLRALGSRRPQLTSDSIETLRASAAAGTHVAVLPARMAARNTELIEIYPEGERSDRDRGLHKLFLISPHNCDSQEMDFLSGAISNLLGELPVK